MRRTLSQIIVASALLAVLFVASGCGVRSEANVTTEVVTEEEAVVDVKEADGFRIDDVPIFGGDAWVSVNNNVPFFTEEDAIGTPFVSYSERDDQGRTGTAMALIGPEQLPGEIGEEWSGYSPSGYSQIAINGEETYRIKSLVGTGLVGGNGDINSVFAATGFLAEAMEQTESEIAAYINSTGNSVLIRSTPVFILDDELASGVLLEAAAMNDPEFAFCRFFYNEQPGLFIDHTTGQVSEDTGYKLANPKTDREVQSLVMDRRTMTFHRDGCKVVRWSKENMAWKAEISCYNARLLGYLPCEECSPQ